MSRWRWLRWDSLRYLFLAWSSYIIIVTQACILLNKDRNGITLAIVNSHMFLLPQVQVSWFIESLWWQSLSIYQTNLPIFNHLRNAWFLGSITILRRWLTWSLGYVTPSSLDLAEVTRVCSCQWAVPRYVNTWIVTWIKKDQQKWRRGIHKTPHKRETLGVHIEGIYKLIYIYTHVYVFF